MNNERQRHYRRPTESSCCELRQYLTETDEQETLDVLREQFGHDQRITSDDVRSVVRAVANRRSTTSLPPDFPPTHWILEFKRAHGLKQTDNIFAIGLPRYLSLGNRSRSGSSIVTASSPNGGRRDDSVRNSEASMRFSMRLKHESDLQMQYSRRQQKRQRFLNVDNHCAGIAWNQRELIVGNSVSGFNASSCSGDSENDTTTGTSSKSSVNAASSTISSDDNRDDCASDRNREPVTSAKSGYKLSHTVSSETWERAIATVEQQGVSLRAAAKIYGVHFAALHRRVKKRAQGGHSSKGANDYFHQSDEAGIMRVVVARAELGVLMTFNELMKLVEAAALRKFPDISMVTARKLVARFQSRNQKLVWHIVLDWPPSVPTTMSSSLAAAHHHMDHPGYHCGFMFSSTANIQRDFTTRAVDGSATAAVVPVAPLHMLLPSSSIHGNRPMLPSVHVDKNFPPLLLPNKNSNLSTRW